MTTTLASITSLLAQLPERDTAASAGEELRDYLVTATELIANYTGMSLSTGQTVLYFDTFGGYRPMGLNVDSGFNKTAHMTINLPVRGPLGALTVLYREPDTHDTAADWARAAPLEEGVDYIHETHLGRLRLLRKVRDMVRGLRVSYSTSGESYPDIAIGALRTSYIADTGVETDFSPLSGLVSGVAYKEQDKSAVAPAKSGPLKASIVLEPGKPRALATIELTGPRNAPMYGDGTEAMDVDLTGIASDGSEELLDSIHTASPMNVFQYVLGGDRDRAFKSYRVDFRGGPALPVYLSRMNLQYMHPVWRHCEGSVPAALSRACAMLAYSLYRRDDLDGVGRSTDASNRGYNSNGSIPKEIREMLAPFMQMGSGVMFI